MERRLAAILAADVVGYSRLMGQDEAGTLAALKALRSDVIDPKIVEHKGRIFKATGDGVLVEFPSVVNAVACGTAIQSTLNNQDQGKAKTLALRIGVHVGDVIIEGDDIFGEGVNIAARLEALAEPGGICISAKVYEEVRGKIELTFEDRGDQTLKNIERPVRVYHSLQRSPLREVSLAPPSTSIPTTPSVAVLPFNNLSGDPEQQYFSDGITEDIITELSRFRSLLVIARNSSFQYRAAMDVKRIARELNVAYVAEGSVRKAGGRIRITAQLIEATSGNHVWAEHYDRDTQDIFAVQDEVTQAIAATIEGRMAASGAQRTRRKPTQDLAAYECFLQARENMEHRGDPEVAVQFLQQAVELDPGFALAYAWLSRQYIYLFHLELRSESLAMALSLAERAVSLDEADAWSHSVMGHAYLIGGRHDQARLHIDRAVALNPTDVRITTMRAIWLAFMGRGEEGVQFLDADLRRDPYPPAWYWNHRAIALFQARRYKEAVDLVDHLQKQMPWDLYYLVAANTHLGLLEKARTGAAKLLQARPNFSLGQVCLTEPFEDSNDLNHLLDGLRKAGLPE